MCDKKSTSMSTNISAPPTKTISYNGPDEIGGFSESCKEDAPEIEGTFDDSQLSFCGLKINKDTLPLKVTLFLYYGAMAAILPYLTIHMLNIGISISETAIIYGVLPFTSFLGPPVVGFLADKLGQYKTVLIIATFSNAFFHTMLLAVPEYREIDVQEEVHLHWSPQSNQVFLVPAVLSDDNCNAFINSFKDSISLATDISYCLEGSYPPSEHSLLSSPPFIENGVGNSSFSSINLGLNISNLLNSTMGSDYEDDLDRTKLSQIAGEYCILEKSESGLLEFTCSDELSDLGLSADILNGSAEEEMEKIDVTLSLMGMTNCSLRVRSPFADVLNASTISCQTELVFDSGVTLIEGNNAVTFWVYFLIRVIATIFMSSCFSLLDATTLAIVKKTAEDGRKAEYGAERIWTVLGTAAISPIAGLLVDFYSKKDDTDYSAAFYVSDVLFVLNILSYFVIKLDVDKPEKNFLSDGKRLFKYPEVVVFLIMIFILGNMWGFVESYLFVFLKDELDAPNYLLGLTLTTGSLTGIPFLYGAERIVNKIGRVNVIVLAFLFYFIRFIGYSHVWSPWWCFPFEALEAFTYHLMWTAAATYCSILAPKGLLATLMGVMGALHYSLGKGFGGFIGGYVINMVGVREAFQDFGIASGIFGLAYFIINIWLKKSIKKRTVRELGEISEVSKGVSMQSKPVDANSNDPEDGEDNEDELNDIQVTEFMLKKPNCTDGS